MIRTIGRTQSIVFRREKPPSARAICTAVCVYFFGALGVHMIDPGFLLMAWLMAGGLAFTIWLTIEARGSFLNPYTLFFAGAVAICLGGFIV